MGQGGVESPPPTSSSGPWGSGRFPAKQDRKGRDWPPLPPEELGAFWVLLFLFVSWPNLEI